MLFRDAESQVFRILSRKTASPSAERRLWVSWNARIEHAYDQIHAITSEAQLAEVVSGAEAVRPFGHRYSSADISAGSATLLDMTSYDQIVSVDEAHREITAQSGVTLKALLRRIESLGWAIPCLPDIDGVTLGGALATGTHGTGREGHILSHYMSRCRLVTAQGSVLELDEEHELMPAVRVSLGVLGVFSEITMRCVPSYTLHIKERPVPDDLWLRDLERLHAEHEFLRLLWLPHTGYGYLITGDRIDPSAPVIEDRGPSWLKRRRAASKWLYRYTWRFPRLTSFANKILFAAFFSFKKEHKGTLYGATVTKRRGSTMQLAEWSIPRRLFPEVFSELKRALNDPREPRLRTRADGHQVLKARPALAQLPPTMRTASPWDASAATPSTPRTTRRSRPSRTSSSITAAGLTGPSSSRPRARTSSASIRNLRPSVSCARGLIRQASF